MKRKKRKSVILLIGVLLSMLLLSTSSVWGETSKGSISVQLDKIGTPLQGVNLFCYQVGDPVKENDVIEGWEALEEYSSLNLNLNELEDTQKHKETAEKLEAYVNQKELPPFLKGATDEAGKLRFENLEEGMYLIVQKSGRSVYGTIQPFLINIPYTEDGIFLYDVETQTKGELPITPSPELTPSPSVTEMPPKPSVTPGNTGTPDIPDNTYPEEYTPDNTNPVKTGDDAPVESMLLLMAAALICTGILLRRKRIK